MSGARLWFLTGLALTAFAANSLLCRAALSQTAIDPATFTLVRIVSGAIVLSVLARSAGHAGRPGGTWSAALALLAYAICFSFAYAVLPAGTGALLLFGAVQASMFARGLMTGERLRPVQWGGLAMALGGLVVLVAPGIGAPDPMGAALMVASGVAWGIFSLLGRGSTEAPVAASAGNFLRAAPVALLPVLIMALAGRTGWDVPGLVLAIVSGAVTSGLGYIVWYAVLPSLSATGAATIQLGVPAIAALAGILLLGEAVTLRLVLASAAILLGVGLVLRKKASRQPPSHV